MTTPPWGHKPPPVIGSWVRPPTGDPYRERVRPNRSHQVHEVNADGTWVALCDAEARQIPNLLPGVANEQADDRCLKCQQNRPLSRQLAIQPRSPTLSPSVDREELRMSADTAFGCVVCGAATDRFLCGSERAETGCIGNLLRLLGDTAALVDDLNTSLSRQDKIGGASIGFVSNGGDDQPLPINTGAMDAGLRLRDILYSWARCLWEENSGYHPHCSACGVEQALHAEGPVQVDRTWYDAVPTLNVEPRIVPLSRWLMRHAGWIALHPAADEIVDEIGECVRLARCSIDSAPGKVYIGRCSTVIEQWWGVDERPEGPPPECGEQLYAREGDWERRCPTCSTIYDVQGSQEVLSAAAEHEYVPQGVLIGLVNGRGERLTGSMFRNLRARKRIVPFVRVVDGDVGASVMDAHGWCVRARTVDDVGLEALYHVGKVLDVLTTGKYARTAIAA